MRAIVGIVVAAVGLAAQPAYARLDRTATKFWNGVQTTCNITAAQPATKVGERIAQSAINEFSEFGGHEIDSDGRLFHFGLTEAEHEEDEEGGRQAGTGHLGWWRVMKYWRELFNDDPASKLEVRGYRDASSAENAQEAERLRTSAAELLRLAEGVSDPDLREVLRESALRSAIVDTSWSAAFISYVIREAGVEPKDFKFANAHRVYIYDAFAASAAELKNETHDGIYRACPLATRPRAGDMICMQREPELAGSSDGEVREHVREELESDTQKRSIRRSHCEVVAYVDKGARKVYSIGGNVNQSVTARKLNLRQNLTFSASQRGSCSGPSHWKLPQPAGAAAHAPDLSRNCSLNDKKWFVLLQLR